MASFFGFCTAAVTSWPCRNSLIEDLPTDAPDRREDRELHLFLLGQWASRLPIRVREWEDSRQHLEAQSDREE
jgi:hypothetical protein